MKEIEERYDRAQQRLFISLLNFYWKDQSSLNIEHYEGVSQATKQWVNPFMDECE